MTVLEGAGMTETINTAQLTMTLQEEILSLSVPFLMIYYSTVIVGGWSKT